MPVEARPVLALAQLPEQLCEAFLVGRLAQKLDGLTVSLRGLLELLCLRQKRAQGLELCDESCRGKLSVLLQLLDSLFLVNGGQLIFPQPLPAPDDILLQGGKYQMALLGRIKPEGLGHVAQLQERRNRLVEAAHLELRTGPPEAFVELQPAELAVLLVIHADKAVEPEMPAITPVNTAERRSERLPRRLLLPQSRKARAPELKLRFR